MSGKRIIFFLLLAASIVVLAAIPPKPLQWGRVLQNGSGLIVGRNVNMVSDRGMPFGDPHLQRQNEPSGTASGRNSLHLFVVSNDYRTIDIPFMDILPGIEGTAQAPDAWIGVFKSYDGGQSWISTLLPGYPQELLLQGYTQGVAESPLKEFGVACDGKACAGAFGLLYVSGIAFNREDRGSGAVFVARYQDRNDREISAEDIVNNPELDPIQHDATFIVDRGTGGQFIDMPFMAVDIPREITRQSRVRTHADIPAGASPGNLYIAYTVFLGNTDLNVRSRIMFSCSEDAGETWSKPIKISESQHIIQRPVIVIDPSDPYGNTIYVAFRRFAHGNKSDAIEIVKSIDGGKTFSLPFEVATINPFDQGTSEVSFRTNSYPAMCVDELGEVYVVWSERIVDLLRPEKPARIVVTRSSDGFNWTVPFPVEDAPNIRGHQFMPDITCAAGNKIVSWYDQRNDIAAAPPPVGIGNAAFTEYITDYGVRHTVDVRAAQIDAAAAGSISILSPPQFKPSVQVSRYLHVLEIGPGGDPTGIIKQAEWSPINFPLFQLGTTPFHGDWQEIFAAPSLLPPYHPDNPNPGQWSYNMSSHRPTIYYSVFADNRDVWTPGGNWWVDFSLYHKPETEPGQGCDDVQDYTGMLNQNVYSAPITEGLVVGSPQNSKQLNIPRAFVVFVKNTTANEKIIDLEIVEGQSYSSFNRFGLPDRDRLEDVVLHPFSTYAHTVFVDAVSGKARVVVNVYENGNLVGRILLNPDPSNPDVVDVPGYDPLSIEEYHNPRVWNPRVWNYDLGNINELNPRVLNTGEQDYDSINPRVLNPRVWNEDPTNPRVLNPRADNISYVNQETTNPRVWNPRVLNTSLTDITWPIRNEGNTASVFNIFLRSLFPEDFDYEKLVAQLLVYKVHTNPIAERCELKVAHHDELVANITNPRVWNPRVLNAPEVGLSQEEEEVPNATIYLEPWHEGYVTVRIWDDDTTDDIVFNTDNITIDLPAQAPNPQQTEPEIGVPPRDPFDPVTPPLPEIWNAPRFLSFTASEGGGNPPSQTIEVMNSGGGDLSYIIKSNVPWISVTPDYGISPVNPEGGEVHNVYVDISDMEAGIYYGNVIIHTPGISPYLIASNNPQIIRVTLYITSGATATQVDLTGPVWVESGDLSGAFTLLSLDAAGNPTNVSGDTVFDLSSTSEYATFYSDADGEYPVNQVTIATGTSSVNFYYSDFTSEEYQDSVTASYASGPQNLGSASHNITVVPGGATIPTGLVAWWKGENNAIEEVSESEGTWQGVENGTYAPGVIGDAFSFDGVDDYIDNWGIDVSDLTQFSVEAWVKLNSISKRIDRFVTMAGDAGSPKAVIRHDGENRPGELHFYTGYDQGPLQHIRVREVLQAGCFFHVVGTYENNQMRLFLNGVEVGNLMTTGTISSGNDFVKLSYNPGPSGESLNGLMDEVKIWDYAMSPSEVLANYESVTQNKCTPPLLLSRVPNTSFENNAGDIFDGWEPNDASGTQLRDVSNPHFGGYAIGLISPSDTGQFHSWRTSGFISYDANKDYDLSIWYFLEDFPGFQEEAKVSLKWFDSNGVSTGPSTDFLLDVQGIEAGEWTQETSTVWAAGLPPNTAMVRIEIGRIIQSGTPIPNTTVWLDDISLVACPSSLPTPVLDYTTYVEGEDSVRYYFEVTNRDEFPDELFISSPHLEPCTPSQTWASSRTWTYIYDADGEDPVELKRICGFYTSDGLESLWFEKPLGEQPPTSVFIEIQDRECMETVISNTVNLIIHPDPNVTSIDPDEGPTGSTVNASITGENFVPGWTSVALRKTGESDIAGTIANVNTASIDCSFNLLGANVGSWDVAVTVAGAANQGVLSGGFTVTSAQPSPDINIKQDMTDIADGGDYDFGSHAIGSNTDVIFTIENLGPDDLTITTPIIITGTDSDQFSVQEQPSSPVGQSESTTFTIRFSPTSEGAKSAAIAIGNNDSDENPYDIALTGEAGPPDPFTKIITGDIVEEGGDSFGCAWGDYNNDGYLDLFVPNNYQDNFLYTNNNGDGSFTKVTTGDVVNDGGGSFGSAWGDIDNDGDLDLFVVNWDQNNFLYTNNGNGSFTKVTDGVLVTDYGGESGGCAWGDYDNDGDLDLFLTNEMTTNRLYANNGDGTFTKVTTGVVVSEGEWSYECAWGDYDNDGDLDLFVANWNLNNYLYTNNGDGSFTKVTTGDVVNDGGKSYTCAWGDYDNDGDLDLFVTNENEPNFLYNNNGNGSFTKVTSGSLVEDSGAYGGSTWGDYDNDGDLDMFILGSGQPNSLYSNNGDGSFTKVTSEVLESDEGTSTACAWGDFNNDGNLDMFVPNIFNENNFLYANNGNSNNWINIKCIGVASNVSAIGAKVRVYATIGGDPVWQLREISGGTQSQDSLNAEFGLGNATIVDEIRVEWPSGIVQILEGVSVNQFLTVTETETYEFVDKWGEYGSGDSQFIMPQGVAGDSAGYIYVADSGNDRIQKFSSSGDYVDQWGQSGSGDGDLNNPYGIVIDGGYVYVSETGNGRISKFTTDGVFVATWGTGELYIPQGMAIDNGYLYVASFGNHRIVKYTTDGTYETQWGTQGSGEGEFENPFDVAVDSSGNVYVSDEDNYRVQKFTSIGGFLAEWPTNVHHYMKPQGIAVDSSDYVYVVTHYKVQKFLSNGTFLSVWGNPGGGDGELDSARALFIDDLGYVYVADTQNNRIQKFRRKQ